MVINELAWAGTLADANDEWIELHSPGGAPLDLSRWSLSDGGDVNILLAGVIQPGAYYLLERSDDSAVADVPADLIYTGGLNNAGETLTLRDPQGNIVDTATGAGGWPAGDAGSRASMERVTSGADTPGNWASNYGHVTNGHDKDGNPIRGTPRSANSATVPTPVPTPIPFGVLLNEFLPHPDSDWNNDGLATSDDEYVELFNAGWSTLYLGGFLLDDADGGSAPYIIPEGTVLAPGQPLAFFRAVTSIALNDDGDTVRLLSPAGAVLDSVTYDRDPGQDTAWSRLPDGNGQWTSRSIPTPGGANIGIPAPPPPTVVPASPARAWNDGAWLTFRGRVAALPGAFSSRLISLQDETGGLYVYLGSGTWPPMQMGMEVTVFGYLRTRTGQRELYVRNLWHVGVGDWNDLRPPQPRPVRTGQVGEAIEGDLVTVEGEVVRLESRAFWLDDGSGRVRVYFAASTGVKRPVVRRGQRWRATGIVGEYTTSRSTSPGYRLRVRTGDDVARVTESSGEPLPLTTPEGPEEPEVEPTATPAP